MKIYEVEHGIFKLFCVMILFIFSAFYFRVKCCHQLAKPKGTVGFLSMSLKWSIHISPKYSIISSAFFGTFDLLTINYFLGLFSSLMYSLSFIDLTSITFWLNSSGWRYPLVFSFLLLHTMFHVLIANKLRVESQVCNFSSFLKSCNIVIA